MALNNRFHVKFMLLEIGLLPSRGLTVQSDFQSLIKQITKINGNASFVSYLLETK